MFDVFTEEIEVQIKHGISNLYWYHKDLKKAWERCGVAEQICTRIFAMKMPDGNRPSKRQFMDMLYEELKGSEFNRRLEISRNFVRQLVEHDNFVPQDPKHRIEIAETCALRLRELIKKQTEARSRTELLRLQAQRESRTNYEKELSTIREEFNGLLNLRPQERGYKLQELFCRVLKMNGLECVQPFKIEGEQIDGGIKFDGHFYLIEITFPNKKVGQETIAGLYLKVEGKLEARGIFVSMSGYSQEVINSLPKGKPIRVILLDGVHLANSVSGIYSFNQLLDHAIRLASTKGLIYCSHDLRD